MSQRWGMRVHQLGLGESLLGRDHYLSHSDQRQLGCWLFFDNPLMYELCAIIRCSSWLYVIPDSKVHVDNMGPTWVLSSPGGSHVGPMNLAIRDIAVFIVPRAELLWTSLIATRFWVVVICPIIKCLTVLEFSFILFDLCLFITIFNFILNYVPIVAFWIFTYHKIWILLIIFCFIWNYWIIYFLTCLEVFWSVVS